MHLHTHTQPAAESISRISSVFHSRLSAFLSPLLQVLDERLDRRLVHTFSLLVEAIIRFRHRQHGLLLSELGAYLLSPDRAPAGTKRISNLLRLVPAGACAGFSLAGSFAHGPAHQALSLPAAVVEHPLGVRQ